MPSRIWNTRRQALGNLVPLLLGLVVGTLGFLIHPIAGAILGIFAAYFGVHQWGFFENAKIDRELRARTGKDGELIGFVYRDPPTVLDAHAEIGLLNVESHLLTIATETGTTVLGRDQIKTISRKGNIHSLLMLGGWIALELEDGEFFRLESRKLNTMGASRSRTNQLFVELSNWLKAK